MKPVKQAVVLAAGEGQRLRPITHTTPKPLVPFFGIPLIDWAIDKALRAGCDRIAINAFHCADAIQDHVAALSSHIPAEIRVSVEPRLLGTGGAIARLRHWLEDAPFFVLNADAIFEADLGEVFPRGTQAPALLVTREPRFAAERRLIARGGVLTHLSEASETDGYTFCGLTLADPDLPNRLSEEPSCILRQGFVPHLARLPVQLHETHGFFADTGTPENLLDAHRRGREWVARLRDPPISVHWPR